MAGSPPLEELDPPRMVVVAADPLVREAFVSMLAAQGLEIVDAESDADVVLVDTGADPDSALSNLEDASEDGGAPVVALLAAEESLSPALATGARGAVLRSASAERILAAVLAVSRGLTVVDGPIAPASAEPIDAPVDFEDLTAREQQVLALLADGLSNKRIAKRLEISEHTAKFHIGSILTKLDASTRTEAVVTAARSGLLLL